MARLQQAAESYKELEKRKRDRGAKNKKKQSGGIIRRLILVVWHNEIIQL